MLGSLGNRMLIVLVGTLLATTLSLTFFVQRQTEQQIVDTEDRHVRDLLRTLLLSIDNAYQGYLYHRQATLRERKTELENITELASRQAAGFYRRYQAGEISEAEAKHQATEVIRRMRHADGVGYLWIQDTGLPDPQVLMHATQPDLVGKRPSENPLFYAALDGKENLFAEFARVCLRQGSGFVEYRWPKPTADGETPMQPKVSHVRYFEPWDWVIGTGLYIDDIDREAERRLNAIIAELRSTFTKVRPAETGHLFLFSGDGRLLIEPETPDSGTTEQTPPAMDGVMLERLVDLARPVGSIGLYQRPADENSSPHRQVPEFTYVTAFPPLDWFVAASVYEDRLTAPAVDLRWRVLVLSGLFLLAASLLSWAFARHLSKPLWRLATAARSIQARGISGASIPVGGTTETRELGQCLNDMIRSLDEGAKEKDALLAELSSREENLRTTLDSIGDAVIATDTEGRITGMNPVAESLTGWSSAEITGRPLSEGFNIVNARTHDAVENPVAKVLETGHIVGLANDTLLIARNGRQCQIADSASPIRDPHGRIRGVVLVFRDVTEEYRVRQALQQQQELQRGVFNNSPSLIYAKDPQGLYLFVNRAFESAYGLSEPEICGKSDAQLFSPAVAARLQSDDREVLESGGLFEREETVPQADGDRTYISVKFPLRRQSGEIFAVCGIATDITQRKRAETELRRSTNRLQLALQASHMGTWHWDLNANQVDWSPETLAIFDTTAEAFGGTYEAYLSFAAPEAHEEIDQYVKSFLSAPPGSDIIHYEHRIVTAAGASKWIEVRGTLFRDAQDRLSQMTGICADITARKQQEDELRKLRNYLYNIINSMPSVLIGVDKEGRVTHWNRQAQRASGVDEAEAIGKPLVEIYPQLALEMDRVFQAIRTQQKQSDNRRPLQKAGETHYEDLTIFPLVANGTEGAVIRIDDVTERLRLEEMMIQSEKMLSVGGLAAGMAHEINNPLGGIMQTSEVLTQRLMGDLASNERAAERAGIELTAIRAYMEERGVPRMLNTIRDSSRRAAGIVEDMLGFARRGDATYVERDITELLDQTLKLAGTDYDLKKRYDFKQIEIVRDYPSDLVKVHCEPQKVQQVLLNIFKNGAQAMLEMVSQRDPPASGDETHRPQFILRVRHEPAAGMVRIEITDNGPGMEESVRRRVFEPFFTTKPVGVGTGLGLSVAYFIVTENLAGTLGVESQPGAGSTFVLRLPSAPEAVE